MTPPPPLRRSTRLCQLRGVASSTPPDKTSPQKEQSDTSKTSRAAPKKKRKRTTQAKPKKAKNEAVRNDNDDIEDCLPRTREMELKSDKEALLWVMGIDEAGRGPLAGPVVAAAVVMPHNVAGIMDSKRLTKEEHRQELYEQIISSPNIQWAVAIVDAARIDEINILQATMHGMRMAADAVVNVRPYQRAPEASATRQGCYVVCGRNNEVGESILEEVAVQEETSSSWFALVDGNRVPTDMPCEAEAMVKGDSREYSIAAASILAKVTRDRLMREYDTMYPQYELAQHKGYPTAKHMALVKTHGASPIHRRTFAPLKHMTFDEKGRVVEDQEDSR